MDLEDYLSIPIIFTPSDEFNWMQIQAHCNRVLATREFVEGRMSVEEYEDVLADNGVDVRKAEVYWEEGICLL